MTTKYGTTHIGPRQAARALHASRYANDNGRALNLMVTIDFSTLGIDPSEAGPFFRLIWSSVSRWWSYRRQIGKLTGSFACYAVHEHPEGGPRHVHWFMHVPTDARADIEAAIRKRVEKMSELACLGRALHFLDVEKPGGVAKYTVKGIHPAYAELYYVRAEDQGYIEGRRLTVSRGIGHAARQRTGWKRKRRPSNSVELHP